MVQKPRKIQDFSGKAHPYHRQRFWNLHCFRITSVFGGLRFDSQYFPGYVFQQYSAYVIHSTMNSCSRVVWYCVQYNTIYYYYTRYKHSFTQPVEFLKCALAKYAIMRFAVLHKVGSGLGRTYRKQQKLKLIFSTVNSYIRHEKSRRQSKCITRLPLFVLHLLHAQKTRACICVLLSRSLIFAVQHICCFVVLFSQRNMQYNVCRVTPEADYTIFCPVLQN